jgi:hypothetical protein
LWLFHVGWLLVRLLRPVGAKSPQFRGIAANFIRDSRAVGFGHTGSIFYTAKSPDDLGGEEGFERADGPELGLELCGDCFDARIVNLVCQIFDKSFHVVFPGSNLAVGEMQIVFTKVRIVCKLL